MTEVGNWDMKQVRRKMSVYIYIYHVRIQNQENVLASDIL